MSFEYTLLNYYKSVLYLDIPAIYPTYLTYIEIYLLRTLTYHTLF